MMSVKQKQTLHLIYRKKQKFIKTGINGVKESKIMIFLERNIKNKIKNISFCNIIIL